MYPNTFIQYIDLLLIIRVLLFGVFQDLLVLLDEVGGRSRGLTKDQISRIPTRVFKSDTGTDTTKCKRCTRRNNRNAAILGIINSEQPSCSAKVDDGDSKGAKGVEAMDATKECNICMSEFVNNEKLRILTCFHEFHIKCIDQWIQVCVVSRRGRVRYEGRKGGVGQCVSNHILYYNHFLPLLLICI